MKVRGQILAGKPMEKALRLKPTSHLYKTATNSSNRKLDSIKDWRTSANSAILKSKLSNLPREPLFIVPNSAPWEQLPDVTINTNLVNDTLRSDATHIRKEAATRTLYTLPEAETLVYTDGSAAEGTTNGGSGVFITYQDGEEEHLSFPAGAVTSSYKAELIALDKALDLVVNSNKDQPTIRILTDSKSALERLKSGPSAQTDRTSDNIWRNLSRLRESGSSITMQWIPGHADIPGNEEADRLASLGGQLPQEGAHIDLATATNCISRSLNADWISNIDRTTWHWQTTNNKPLTSVQDLDRKDSITLHQLRTGKSSICQAFLNRINPERYPSDTCQACDDAPETPRHLLLECGAWEAARAQEFGPFASPSTLFDDPAGVIRYLRRIGKIKPTQAQPDGGQ